MLAFAVARFDGRAISQRNAGVVELVDALDSKSSSERSVGSIPTARTILSLQVPTNPPHGGWNLHQWSALGWTARAPLREMTIGRHCHAGIWQTIRAAAIANTYAVCRALWLAKELSYVHAGFIDSMG